MSHVLTAAGWALPLLYLVPLVDYGVSFFLRVRTHARSRWLLLVVVLHLGYLVLWSVACGRPPLERNAEVLSVVAVATAAVYLAVEAAGRDRRTGVFVLLLVFLMQYASSFALASGAAPAEAAGSRWERLHALPAVLAYTAFSLSAVYALLHLVARRDLKQHRFGPLFDRLPPLDLLARMSWRAVLVGFVLLSVTIVSAAGLGLTGRLTAAGGAEFWSLKVTVKVVAGSVAWLVYAVAVVGRAVGKWPAVRVSVIAVNGFVAVALLFAISAALS